MLPAGTNTQMFTVYIGELLNNTTGGVFKTLPLATTTPGTQYFNLKQIRLRSAVAVTGPYDAPVFYRCLVVRRVGGLLLTDPTWRDKFTSNWLYNPNHDEAEIYYDSIQVNNRNGVDFEFDLDVNLMYTNFVERDFCVIFTTSWNGNSALRGCLYYTLRADVNAVAYS